MIFGEKNTKINAKYFEPSYYIAVSSVPIFGNVLDVLINFELVKHLISHRFFSGIIFYRLTSNVFTVITEFVDQDLYKKQLGSICGF